MDFYQSVGQIRDDVNAIRGIGIPAYDYLQNSYTSGNLTQVVYKSGGASGATVATLTLSYDGSGNLTSVTRT